MARGSIVPAPWRDCGINKVITHLLSLSVLGQNNATQRVLQIFAYHAQVGRDREKKSEKREGEKQGKDAAASQATPCLVLVASWHAQVAQVLPYWLCYLFSPVQFQATNYVLTCSHTRSAPCDTPTGRAVPAVYSSFKRLIGNSAIMISDCKRVANTFKEFPTWHGIGILN